VKVAPTEKILSSFISSFLQSKKLSADYKVIEHQMFDFQAKTILVAEFGKILCL